MDVSFGKSRLEGSQLESPIQAGSESSKQAQAVTSGLPPPITSQQTNPNPLPAELQHLTVREYLERRLADNGLFGDEAKGVMNSLVGNPTQESMIGRWDVPLKDSPAPNLMLPLLWMSAKAEAVKWIEANKPMHWAKPLFSSSET